MSAASLTALEVERSEACGRDVRPVPGGQPSVGPDSRHSCDALDVLVMLRGSVSAAALLRIGRRRMSRSWGEQVSLSRIPPTPNEPTAAQAHHAYPHGWNPGESRPQRAGEVSVAAAYRGVAYPAAARRSSAAARHRRTPRHAPVRSPRPRFTGPSRTTARKPRVPVPPPTPDLPEPNRRQLAPLLAFAVHRAISSCD